MPATIQTIQKPTRARALDTSGNNNHGQIYSGRALEFDGISDYLSVSGSTTGIKFIDYTAESTAANRAWTVALWFNFDAVSSSNQHLLGYESVGIDVATSNYLRIDSSEKLGFYDVGGSNHTADTVLIPGTWYRAVFVYNGSDTINFYVNGVADGDGTLTVGDNNNADLDISIIGAKLTNGVVSAAFAGKMSDLQAWQGAWTQSDVTYDYLNPEQLALNNSGTSLTNSNLKLWYPMNDGHRGQQSFISDASNTGIVTGDIITNGSMEGTWHTSDTIAEDWILSSGGTPPVLSQETGVTGYAQGVTGGDANDLIQQSITHVSGVTYKLTATCKIEGAGNAVVRLLSDVIGTSTNVLLFDSTDFETKSYYYTSQETGDSHIRLLHLVQGLKVYMIIFQFIL